MLRKTGQGKRREKQTASAVPPSLKASFPSISDDARNSSGRIMKRRLMIDGLPVTLAHNVAIPSVYLSEAELSDGNHEPFKIILSPFAAPRCTDPVLPSNRTARETTSPHLDHLLNSESYFISAAVPNLYLSPINLLRLEFYHQVSAGVGGVTCWFALKVLQEHHIGGLPNIQREDCLWQITCHSLTPCLPTSSCKYSSADPSVQISAPESNAPPEPRPVPTAPTRGPRGNQPRFICRVASPESRSRTNSIASDHLSSNNPTTPDSYFAPNQNSKLVSLFFEKPSFPHRKRRLDPTNAHLKSPLSQLRIFTAVFTTNPLHSSSLRRNQKTPKHCTWSSVVQGHELEFSAISIFAISKGDAV
ncbi:hypothetical protein PITC_095360 [Penicillium italicum]|uniref:Uncharacterized protein n=1 Tax=Penicillium italicum TaxID=40296 RepID=A0A0A2KNK1_PENIT|nr:hypothetical protein PITC_095360 [Penicillium italicum]